MESIVLSLVFGIRSIELASTSAEHIEGLLCAIQRTIPVDVVKDARVAKIGTIAVPDHASIAKKSESNPNWGLPFGNEKKGRKTTQGSEIVGGRKKHIASVQTKKKR